MMMPSVAHPLWYSLAYGATTASIMKNQFNTVFSFYQIGIARACTIVLQQSKDSMEKINRSMVNKKTKTLQFPCTCQGRSPSGPLR
jgi:hypothetical protein